MSAYPLPFVKPFYMSQTGLAPLAGGLFYSYAAGTSTPLATYTTATGNVANANPVVLDSAGQAAIFLADLAYKLVLTDANGVEMWSQDGIYGTGAPSANPIAIATALTVSLAGDQTVLAAANDVLTLTTTSVAPPCFDASGEWSNVFHGFSPTQAGYYRITCTVNGASASAGWAVQAFALNSGTMQATSRNANDLVTLDGVMSLAAGSILYLKVLAGASNVTVKGGGTQVVYTWASISRVGGPAGPAGERGPGPEFLIANRNYYVRTDGSDLNNGLANTSGGAFLTAQHAIDVASALDFNGWIVTINIGDGTYAESLSIGPLRMGARTADAQGAISFVGNTTTPTNVVISGATCFYTSNGANISVSGLRLVATSTALYADYNSAITIGSAIVFGAATTQHMRAINGGMINLNANYTIAGASAAHLDARLNGLITTGGAITVTVSGTPAFSGAFARCVSAGIMNVPSITYSGAATGQRYSVTLNALLNTSGGGASYFPGDSVGQTATGGQYA